MARARSACRPTGLPWMTPRNGSSRRGSQSSLPHAALPTVYPEKRWGGCAACPPEEPWLNVPQLAVFLSKTQNAVRCYHRTRSMCGFPSVKLMGKIAAKRCCVDTWARRGGVPA